MTMADDNKELRDAYVQAMVENVEQGRRWAWITAITGTAALGVGALLGAWATARSYRVQKELT